MIGVSIQTRSGVGRAGVRQAITTKLHAHRARLFARLTEGVSDAASVLLEESRKECPVDTTVLRETSAVQFPKQAATPTVPRVEATVGYGPAGVKIAAWSGKDKKWVVREPYTYAYWVHVGVPSKNIEANPFLERARTASIPLMRQALKVVFQAGIGF